MLLSGNGRSHESTAADLFEMSCSKPPLALSRLLAPTATRRIPLQYN